MDTVEIISTTKVIFYILEAIIREELQKVSSGYLLQAVF